jgi:hypothetical protein
MAHFGFRRASTMLLKGRHEAVGMSYAELTDLAKRMDLLINIGGALQDHALMLRLRRRLYLDLTPGFTQLAAQVQKRDMRFADHTHHATVGLNLGSPTCPIPTCGVKWITTPQPVVLEHWPVTEQPPEYDALTTVANWRGDGSIEHGGVFFGQKAHSLRELMALPTKTKEKFALALAMGEADEASDRAALKASGWRLLDPQLVAPSPQKFQQFVQTSKGEFAVAKSGYVHSHVGRLSDRSLCYLASGRPVIAQDTGFAAFVPPGEGLCSFSDEASALRAIDRVNADYDKHRRAARAMAEKHFDSDKVLGDLLSKVA